MSNYDKSKHLGARNRVVALIKDNMEFIVRENERIFVSAREVMNVLEKGGLLAAEGIHLRCANGIGDVLGAKHFKLPFAMVGSSRRYLIPAVLWTAEEIQEFYKLSDAECKNRLSNLADELVTGAAPAKDSEESAAPEKEVEHDDDDVDEDEEEDLMLSDDDE